MIATRDSLFNLPYSIKEIYRIRTVSRRSKYQEYDRIYSEFYPIYDDSVKYVRPDAVIVEDSNAAYDFFNALCQKEGIRCISAGGKTGIYSKIKETADEVVLVIADGTAFGPEMERVMSLRRVRNTVLFLPESFEWLILRSGLIGGAEVQDILKSPYDYIESDRYFSWERFFTVLLTERTVDTHLQYSKRRLNPNYLNDRETLAIRKVVSDMTVGNGQT